MIMFCFFNKQQLDTNLGMQQITKKIVLGVNKDYYDSLFLGKIFEVDFVTGKSNIFLKKQK